MDTPSIIREYLDENNIYAVRSIETAYRYHVELEPGCRIASCELIMRCVGEEVFVRAELPISVMTKETRGVVKYLADLNRRRIEESKQGFFDLDYVAGKIVFAIRVRQPITPALLKEVADYCIDQIEYESDDLIKTVYEEYELAYQEEEALRRQRERESREPSAFALLMRKLKTVIRNKLDPDSSRNQAPVGLPVAEPAVSESDEPVEPADQKQEEINDQQSAAAEEVSAAAEEAVEEEEISVSKEELSDDLMEDMDDEPVLFIEEDDAEETVILPESEEKEDKEESSAEE